MPTPTLENQLESLLQQYIPKDWKEKVVRDALVKDILILVNNFAIAKKGHAIVMTPDAAAYKKGDVLKIRPKSV